MTRSSFLSVNLGLEVCQAVHNPLKAAPYLLPGAHLFFNGKAGCFGLNYQLPV